VERSDFFALPPAIALRVLFDCLGEDAARKLSQKEKPIEPRAPKFDRSIFRKEGIMWASETSFEGLVFWHKRATEPASDPKYQDANVKQAAELARWIAWREWYPEAVWSGERNRELVVAKAPSSKPTVYPRTGGGNRPPPPPPDDVVDQDSDTPFICNATEDTSELWWRF
jgi:hypothetical protein